MNDRLEVLQLGRADVADVADDGPNRPYLRSEVAASVKLGVESQDVVPRFCQEGCQDRADVALTSGNEDAHRDADYWSATRLRRPPVRVSSPHVRMSPRSSCAGDLGAELVRHGTCPSRNGEGCERQMIGVRLSLSISTASRKSVMKTGRVSAGSVGTTSARPNTRSLTPSDASGE